MSVHTKQPTYVEFPEGAERTVQADSVFVKVVEKCEQEYGEATDRLALLGLVADVANKVITGPEGIQAKKVEALTKKGLRRPVKDEPVEDGEFVDKDVSAEILTFAELPAAEQEQFTDLFNLIRGELVVAGRLAAS